MFSHDSDKVEWSSGSLPFYISMPYTCFHCTKTTHRHEEKQLTLVLGELPGDFLVDTTNSTYILQLIRLFSEIGVEHPIDTFTEIPLFSARLNVKLCTRGLPWAPPILYLEHRRLRDGYYSVKANAVTSALVAKKVDPNGWNRCQLLSQLYYHDSYSTV